MLIGVTGGTGYVGAHCVRALLAGGHHVRLLVGPDAEGAPVLRRFAGYVEVLSGDIRETTTIEALLDGCDAVLHAAGVVGTDNRRSELMWQVNAYATESVLTRAVDRGLDPVVSVSTYSALFPPPDGVIGPDTPPRRVAVRTPRPRATPTASRGGCSCRAHPWSPPTRRAWWARRTTRPPASPSAVGRRSSGSGSRPGCSAVCR